MLASHAGHIRSLPMVLTLPQPWSEEDGAIQGPMDSASLREREFT